MEKFKFFIAIILLKVYKHERKRDNLIKKFLAVNCDRIL